MLLNAVEPGGESYRQLQQVVFGSAAAAAADGGALDALNSQLLQLSMALTQESSATLSVSDANSVWVAQRYQLQAAYADALKASFGAAAAPITSAAAINAWVEGATGGKIRELVDESAVRQATIILINAIYFKGDWLHPFKKAATVPRDFFPLLHSSTTVQAATMSQTYKPVSKIRTALLPAVTNGGTKLTCPAVCLPYKAANSPNSGSPAVRARGRQEREQPGEFYGVVAMPGGELSTTAADDGSRRLVLHGGATVSYREALTACRTALLSNLLPPEVGADGGAAESPWQLQERKDIKLYLPRFEVDFCASLNDSLSALGVKKPFAGGDITRIAADGSGNALRDLFVSDVLHKVYAKVDETGTEAAAATAVMMCRCAMPMPREEMELRFDRPFIFAVVHGPSGLALFCGEVHNPET